MATHRSGHRPAGGLHSKQTVHRPLSKAEPKPHAIDPGAVSQIGISSFLGREPLREGKGYGPVGPTDNVAAVGVGGGRTVYKSGGQHGLQRPAREMPAGRDTLAEYGPESITSKERG
jgi:hypothetical protein